YWFEVKTVRCIVVCRYCFWVTVHHNGFVAIFTKR
ncbi:hypothetical protein D030_2392B, partial [Vibrio parahaemolyticus AQ3810]